MLDLYAQLGQEPFPDEQMEQFRATVCAPDFVAPDRDKVEVSAALYIRSTAQSDAEIGERWLAEGILTVFERVDQGNGTVLFNIDWSDEVLARLADVSTGLYDALASDPERYCGELA